MDNFTIKDLENLSGIKAHTIRVWEQRYHFLKPRRTDTNIRYYSNEELKTVLNISLLIKYGYKISHIDKMDPLQIRERITSLGDARAQKEKDVNELLHQMIDLNIAGFEKLLSNHIRTKGIERTVTQIIFSFLERTGVLWQTGHINPAHEHLVTNIIRQKMLVVIDACQVPVNKKKSAMLFLPEGEHHELGILYIYYLLKKTGVAVIYLGANAPLKDAEYIAKLKNTDIIFMHLTNPAAFPSFSGLLKKIQLSFKGQRVIISGVIVREYNKLTPDGIELKKSLAEITELIANLS
ncbi:MAG TPA: MerR family transcriptional regulator [Chitinophagaceae bacterium]|nr:MerR family transcriptional regulator [Chitinophagaceae bacterium]